MIEPLPRDEEELNAWYDTEHLADRLSIPGFISARRWECEEATGVGKYLATYELDSPGVLDSNVYKKVSGEASTPWTKRRVKLATVLRRWKCTQLVPGTALPPTETAALFFECGDVHSQHEAKFNRWYDAEHLPRMASLPGVLAARRFIDPSGTPRYIALYDLASTAVPLSKEWQAAYATPAALRIGELTKVAWIRRCYRAYLPKESSALRPRE